MYLRKIKSHHLPVHELNIISHEGDIYIAEVRIHDHVSVIRDEITDQPVIFHSVNSVKESFHGINIGYMNLIHYTPYDEMIGNDAECAGKTIMHSNVA
ncbi:DUF6482 family protein [Spartinivicinus ruber]|uniref:DUF6482 family protein n=1 Tax=Spartinivicinus ruber TaxID=2683272 RepID=UPI0013CF56EB|nr:DUF6482 family protein [Spartinivicinus ruber]